MKPEVVAYTEGRLYIRRPPNTSMDREQTFMLEVDELDELLPQLQGAKDKVIALKRAEAAKLTAEADQLETRERTAMDELTSLRDEIDRLRLENQFLQDQVNALLMEVHDLKANLEDAAEERRFHDAA